MIKVRDVAYVRFAAPDLDRMERFLTDFGLVVTAREDDRLFARATDPSPYVHVTERGEAGFRAVAFEAATAEDLEAAARLEGASAVEKIDAPGGGQRVRFSDPDGFTVEVVHGRETLAPLPVRSAAPLNRGSDRTRLGRLQRVEAGPASVKRLGHVVVRVSDFRRSSDWYRSRFGFVVSDEVYLGEKKNVVTAFLRCDLGAEYTDHHTFLCVGLGEVGFDHAAFEVEDIDAVMVGHDHLKQAGYEHHAGIGRHVLGSQVFDYWRDPWGHVVEHFTDGDLLNDRHETAQHDPATALGTQWGRFGPP
ncbi:MAG: VOC family protein [Myxococcota bacterium]|nr:VOC family protein [Myxococcota bacterium]